MQMPDPIQLKRIALEASVDPRTLRRVLRGEEVRGMAGYRAREALAARGLLPTAPVQKDASP